MAFFLACLMASVVCALLGLPSPGYVNFAFAQSGIAVVPPSEFVPPEASSRLVTLARQRQQLFQQAAFDRLAKDVGEAQQKLTQLNAGIAQAQKAFISTSQNARRLHGLAQGGAGEGLVGQAATARDEANRIEAEGNRLIGLRNEYQKEKVAPLMEAMARLDREWSKIYDDMREQIPRDRTDPQASAIADTLDRITSDDPSFVEGYVLGAVASLFTDRPVEDAERLLDEAYEKRSLFISPTSPLALDFCYACCLAQRPKRADRIIKELKEIPDRQKTIEQDWIIGLHGLFSGKLNDAKRYFQSATVELKKQLDADDKTPHPVVLADAVVMFMSSPSQQERGRTLYKMDRGVSTSGLWQALRAQAMILAEDERFPEAAAAMRACVSRAPDSLRKELGEQVTHYEAKQLWRKK